MFHNLFIDQCFFEFAREPIVSFTNTWFMTWGDVLSPRLAQSPSRSLQQPVPARGCRDPTIYHPAPAPACLVAAEAAIYRCLPIDTKGSWSTLGCLEIQLNWRLICRSGTLLVPSLLRAGVGDRDELLDFCHRCGAELWDRSVPGSCPAAPAFLWSRLCPRCGPPATCAGPLWVYRRNRSNGFQDPLADHSLIICFKR